MSRIGRGIQRRLNRVASRIHPLRAHDIRQAFDRLQVESSLLLLHSSLSHCGHVSGGSRTIVNELRERCATLALPTHSYCYPDDDHAPVFDSRTTPSRVGAITNWFWKCDGVLRSRHPTHSVAASGPLADEIVSGHELCETPCGTGTPYHKLMHHDCSVLMFGCPMSSYTLFHTAESLLPCRYLFFPGQSVLRFRDADGKEKNLISRCQSMESPRRFAEMENILREEGLLTSTELGKSKLLFVKSARNVHNFVMDNLSRNPEYLLKQQVS